MPHHGDALDAGATQFFDTEMLALSISGGGLPGGMMIRESPTKASLGRTTIRPDPGGGYRIGSFFDIFTEMSTDGGQTWLAVQSGPATLQLRPLAAPPRRVNRPNTSSTSMRA